MFKQIFKFETLMLTRPFGATLLWTVLMFPFLMGSSELFTRSLLADPVFPPPSVGSSNPEFEVKLDHLNQLVERDGFVDCILLGSSQVDGGLNPVAISEAYEKKTGQSLTCYNFGVSTLTAEVQGVLAQILVKQYHPRLLILGTSPRDFSSLYGEQSRPLLKLPWVKYQLGNYSYEGWLIDHSSSYRYYLGITNWKDPKNRKVIEKYENLIDGLGYDPLPNTGEPLGDVPGVLLKEYKLNKADVKGIQKALALNGAETRVVLLEMPVHPDFFPYYIEGGEAAFLEKFFEPITKLADEHKVAFWSTQRTVAPKVPEGDWNDFRHLNVDGAKIFSAWLGEQIADAQQQGLIPKMRSGSLVP